MFNTDFIFRIMVRKDNDAITEILSLLKEIGITIMELREADIHNSNKSIIDEVYLIGCKSSVSIYQKIRYVFTNELAHENFTTIY